MKVKIFIKEIISKHQYARIFLSVFLIACSTSIFSQEEGDETSVINDIYSALTLQGINCDEISELKESEEGSYDVVCKSGGHFLISQTRNGILSVVDQITGVVRKGVGVLFGAVPFTGQFFKQSDELTEHEIEVARSLFSIINLSGNTCDTVTEVVSSSNDEHIVSCENNLKYRVFTKGDGLVAVEAVLTDS